LDGKGKGDPSGPNGSRKSSFQTYMKKLAAYALHKRKVKLRVIHDFAHLIPLVFPDIMGFVFTSCKLLGRC
jgi:hypothetical protein